MRWGALLILLWVGAAQAGVEAFDKCMIEDRADMATAKFTERFPHEACTPFNDCPLKLRQTVLALVDRQCRELALDDCLSAKCRLGLKDRWTADAAFREASIRDWLAKVDLDALPPLQKRRLANPERWVSPVTCTGDAVTCEALAAGQYLGDLNRILSEIGQLR